MAVIIVRSSLTKNDVKSAREEYDTYIKITADIKQKIVAIGGEYHADAKKILATKYNSQNSDIWGGGYDVLLKKFTTDAILNIKPNYNNDSTEILNPTSRELFLKLARTKLKNIESLI